MTWRDIHRQLAAEKKKFLDAIQGNLKAIEKLSEPLGGFEPGSPQAIEFATNRSQEALLAMQHYASTGQWPLMAPEVAAICVQRILAALALCECVCPVDEQPMQDEPQIPDEHRVRILSWLLVEYPVLVGMPRQFYRSQGHRVRD